MIYIDRWLDRQYHSYIFECIRGIKSITMISYKITKYARFLLEFGLFEV